VFSFSEKSQIILKDIGWFAERKVNPLTWINNLEAAGYKAFDVARKILEHLGGLDSNNASNLSTTPIFLSDKTQILFATHPAFDFIADNTPDSDRDSAIYWKENAFIKNNGLDIFPIGSIRGIITLFVVSDGRIFKGQFYTPQGYDGENRASLIFIGNTISEAINKLTEQTIAYL